MKILGIIIAVAAILGSIGYRADQHTHAVCDGSHNYALCKLGQMAGKSDAQSRADGNL